MLQTSKVIKSRNDWKQKANEKAYEARELRKTKKRHKIIIEKQKEKITRLEQIISAMSKKN